MNRINDLIERNNLRIIDAIVLKKKFIGMVDHYVLFGGYNDYGQPLFLANYDKGVKFVSNEEMNKYLQILEPKRVMYFQGDESQRKAAVMRAKSRIGERAYDYLKNNCEHFAIWVHTGKHKSEQVASAGAGLMAAGGAAAIGGLARKNDTIAAVGLGALLLGALLKFGFNDVDEL